MNPAESDNAKTTHEKKCPECGSQNVTLFAGHGVAATDRSPDPTRCLFRCENCEKAFWYVGSLS